MSVASFSRKKLFRDKAVFILYQVLIVDHYPTVGAGTKFILEQNDDFYVTYVKTGAIALQLIAKMKFDIMLCDLYTVDTDSVTLAKQVLQLDPNLKIFIFTGYAYDHVFNEFMDIGVCGFLSKTMSLDELQENIYKGLKGETIVPTHLFKRLRAVEEETLHEVNVKLTSRERHIVNCLMKGLSNRQIADQIYLSQRAVEYQLQKLYKKFEVRTRPELIKYIHEHNLLSVNYTTL